jgi:hypothetical protein
MSWERNYNDEREGIMKEDEKLKEAGKNPSAESTDETKQLGRGEFLKTIGVGAAAAGLGILTGDQSSASAATESDSSRSAIQKLMRNLLESPSKAKAFLDSPQAVAKEFGVYLSNDDSKTIQETLKKLSTQIALREGHDQIGPSGHNLWYTKALPVQPGQGKTAPVEKEPPTHKAPSGGKRR